MNIQSFMKYTISAQKKFEKIYNNEDSGLIAITDCYVQVTEKKMKEIVDAFQGEIEYTTRKIINGYEVSIIIDKVNFLTVGTKKELQKVKLME